MDVPASHLPSFADANVVGAGTRAGPGVPGLLGAVRPGGDLDGEEAGGWVGWVDLGGGGDGVCV